MMLVCFVDSFWMNFLIGYFCMVCMLNKALNNFCFPFFVTVELVKLYALSILYFYSSPFPPPPLFYDNKIIG